MHLRANFATMKPRTTRISVFALVSSAILPIINVLATQQATLDSSIAYFTNAGITSVPKDLHPDCATWSDLGECHLYYEYMYEHCTGSCVTGEDLGAVGYFLHQNEGESRDEKCYNRQDFDPDVSSTCEELADRGDCHMNPKYMMENCARSCLLCLPAGVETFEIGVPQEILAEYQDDESHIKKTLEVITSTNEYMSTKVMEESSYDYVRRSCYNRGIQCASMAALGHCSASKKNKHYNYMMANCAPACQTCILFELLETCTPDEEDNIFEKDDLNKMFMRIMREETLAEGTMVPDYGVVVHSKNADLPAELKDNNTPILGPWVVTLDNFLSDEECDRLIEVGFTNENEKELKKEVNDHTSLHSLCKSECYSDPIVAGIIQQMSDMTGIPKDNSEYLQMLKYTAGQKYDYSYHSAKDSHEEIPGPVVATIFLFLNDVEEGGEIRFEGLSVNGDHISRNIKPKKGSAIIWQGVENDYPSAVVEQTIHQFLPVKRGVQYGVKAMFHLRSYDYDNCDYNLFHKYKEYMSARY